MVQWPTFCPSESEFTLILLETYLNNLQITFKIKFLELVKKSEIFHQIVPPSEQKVTSPSGLVPRICTSPGTFSTSLGPITGTISSQISDIFCSISSLASPLCWTCVLFLLSWTGTSGVFLLRLEPAIQVQVLRFKERKTCQCLQRRLSHRPILFRSIKYLSSLESWFESHCGWKKVVGTGNKELMSAEVRGSVI